MPNPFFVSPAWWADLGAEAKRTAAARPWGRRVDKVLFRGNCGPGAAARLELMSLRGLDDALDVGFTGVDGYASLADCVDDLAERHGLVPRGGADVAVPPLPMANYSHFRYLLHMPGSATGSYSRNLQYLFTHGAVVLVWRHAAEEWYYRDLVDGKHYVAVDRLSLAPTLAALRRDAPRREALVRGARDFYEAHLGAASLVGRWRDTLRVLDDRQDADPPRVDKAAACTCDAALAATYATCEKCEITRKRGNPIRKFVGLVPKKPKAQPPSSQSGLSSQTAL